MNGQPFSVTDNLHIALQHLKRNEERLLWIDAICINQSDNGERLHQVRMMADIYRRCSGCAYVWLGPSMDDSDAVMDLIINEAKESEPESY